MASGARLGPNDLDGALAVVAEAAGAEGGHPFDLPVIERLLGLIPADRGGYFEKRKPGDVIYKVENGPWGITWDSETQALRKWWALHLWDGTDYAVRLSDLLTRKQRLRNPWCNEVMRPRSIEHQMKVRLPAPPGTIRAFWVERSPDSRDFDDRDRAVLTVLGPHLAAIRERWERQHRPTLLLTRRETAVLELVREGLTNHEIAARLVITSGTVRSHLEHTFEKLGVHTRTAAVARAFGSST